MSHTRIPRIPSIQLKVDPGVERRFRQQAREAFPKETLAYLMGHDYGNRMEVVDLWVPPADLTKATSYYIDLAEHIDWEAAEYAKSEGLQLLGDIHTHPWTHSEVDLRRRIRFSSPISPSASDWDRLEGVRWLMGICLIEQMANQRLRCQFRYWGPITQIVRV